MDLYILNEINKLKNGGGGGGSSSAGASVGEYGIETSPDSAYPSLKSWVSFYSENRRYHSDAYRWDNSFPEYGSFYAYGNSDSDAMLGFWNSCGFTRSGNSPNGAGDQMSHRMVCQSLKGTVGNSTHTITMYSGEDYTPWSSNVMWVRNPTSSDVTVSLGSIYTNKWHNGYEGACLYRLIPNATAYSQVTGVNPQRVWGASGSNSWYDNRTENVTFPANKTIALLQMTNSQWWTSTNSGGMTHNVNHFHSLQNLDN